MDQGIGDAAGKVWQCLNDLGGCTIYRIIRHTGLSRTMAQRAIGWLAREDKIDIQKTNRAETVRLR